MTEAKQTDINPPELKKSKKARNSSLRDLQILTDQDQETLKQLQSALSSTGSRNLRGKQLKTFSDMINIIQKFCIRGDAYDWRRCFVCGICWLNNGIAINNRRFGSLLGKCKSSINGSFQQLGYTTAPSRSESYDSIVEAIPILKNDMPSLREWTLRIRNSNLTPQAAVAAAAVAAAAVAAAAADENGQISNTPSGQIIDAQQPLTQLQQIQDGQEISQQTQQVQDQKISIVPQPFSVQSMPQTTNTTAELQAVASFTPDPQNFQQQNQPIQQMQPVQIIPPASISTAVTLNPQTQQVDSASPANEQQETANEQESHAVSINSETTTTDAA